jgi:hypothetical protein
MRLYSPECVEGSFSELRVLFVLRTSPLKSSANFGFRAFSEVFSSFAIYVPRIRRLRDTRFLLSE